MGGDSARVVPTKGSEGTGEAKVWWGRGGEVGRGTQELPEARRGREASPGRGGVGFLERVFEGGELSSIASNSLAVLIPGGFRAGTRSPPRPWGRGKEAVSAEAEATQMRK